MTDLEELYSQLIKDHTKNPRNFGVLAQANRQAPGYNPLCGDKIFLQLKVQDDKVTEIAFQGSGCSISTSSASIMTESVKGKSTAQIEKLFRKFHELVTGDPTQTPPAASELGKLGVFFSVRKFPLRVKCATLPWHTLKAALSNSTETVSTE